MNIDEKLLLTLDKIENNAKPASYYISTFFGIAQASIDLPLIQTFGLVRGIGDYLLISSITLGGAAGGFYLGVGAGYILGETARPLIVSTPNAETQKWLVIGTSCGMVATPIVGGIIGAVMGYNLVTDSVKEKIQNLSQKTAHEIVRPARPITRIAQNKTYTDFALAHANKSITATLPAGMARKIGLKPQQG